MADLKLQFTEAGLAHLLSAKDSGLKGEIAYMAFGSGAYTPSKTQTSLHEEKERIEIVDYQGDGKNLRMAGVFEGEKEYAIREIGVYLSDGTLLGVYSQQGRTLGYRTPSVRVVQWFTLNIEALPTDSVTVVTGAENLNLVIDEEFAQMATAQVDTMHGQLKQEFRLNELDEKTEDIDHLSQSLRQLAESSGKQISQLNHIVDALPESSFSMMDKTVHVDAVSGHNYQSGSILKPVKDFDYALKMIPRGGKGRIVLKRGQVHEITSPGTHGAEKNLIISAWGDSGTRPILRAMPYDSAASVQCNNVFLPDTSVSVKFENVEIQTGKLSGSDVYPYGGAKDNLINAGFGGVFSRNSNNGESAHFDVQFINCVIRQQDFRLFTLMFGNLSLSIAKSEIINEGANPALVDCWIPKILNLDQVTLSGFQSDATVDSIFFIKSGNHLIYQQDVQIKTT